MGFLLFFPFVPWCPTFLYTAPHIIVCLKKPVSPPQARAVTLSVTCSQTGGPVSRGAGLQTANRFTYINSGTNTSSRREKYIFHFGKYNSFSG